MRQLAILTLLPSVLLLAACHGHGGGSDPVEAQGKKRTNYTGIGEGETLHFAGAEPAWRGDVTGGTLSYDAPGKTANVAIPVRRFAGNNGLAFSGTLEGAPFDLAVTDAACSHGISGRTYPFTVTLQIGPQKRAGCGWTDRRGGKQAGKR